MRGVVIFLIVLLLGGIGSLAAGLVLLDRSAVPATETASPTPIESGTHEGGSGQALRGGETEVAELTAVAGASGEGLATRRFDGQQFIHGVEAELPTLGGDKFYEGWLVQKQPRFQFVSTGKLEENNGEFILVFTRGEDYSDFPEVVITEETASLGLDNKPETHILQGSF